MKSSGQNMTSSLFSNKCFASTLFHALTSLCHSRIHHKSEIKSTAIFNKTWCKLVDSSQSCCQIFGTSATALQLSKGCPSLQHGIIPTPCHLSTPSSEPLQKVVEMAPFTLVKLWEYHLCISHPSSILTEVGSDERAPIFLCVRFPPLFPSPCSTRRSFHYLPG